VDRLNAVEIGPDGKIVTVGFTRQNGTERLLLVRID
jgi:hypothetical protein